MTHKLKGEVEQLTDLRGQEEGAWQKRGGAFSPLLDDRIYAMTLANQKTPKQKKIQAMTA